MLKRCDITTTLNLGSGVAVILVTVNAQVGVHYTQYDYKISLNTWDFFYFKPRRYFTYLLAQTFAKHQSSFFLVDAHESMNLFIHLCTFILLFVELITIQFVI